LRAALLAAAVFAAWASPAGADCLGNTLVPGTTTTFATSFGGLPRSYDVHVPASYTGFAPVPLVLDLHGFTSNAFEQRSVSGFLARSDQEGFLVVYPQGTDNSWNAFGCCGNAFTLNVDDVGFLRAVVQEVSAMGNVDHRRVYATGLSNGGAMTHRLACRAADVFAAAAPVSFPLNTTAATCQASRPISVTHFHGLLDTTVPYAGGPPFFFQAAQTSFATWKQIDGCTGTAEVLDLGAPSLCETYTACNGGVEVGLCSLQGSHVLYLGQTVLDIATYAWEQALSPFALSLPDADSDGFADPDDNCAFVANADQADADQTCVGDVCEACPNPTGNDVDGDGVCGDVDNCPAVPNADQANADADARGDACDTCPTVADDGTDGDADGVAQGCDTCTATANPVFTGSTVNRTRVSGQLDDDGDGLGNACDFDYDQIGPVITSGDFNQAKPSVGKLVSTNLCGLAPTNNRPCGIFDHDGLGPAVTSTDFNQSKSKVGSVRPPTCGPACTPPFGSPGSPVIGKAICEGPRC
jgi:polyhydroxybutyrate depolymerase